MNTNKPARWFRMYAEFASDPKVQMLSETDQRRYLMILCLRCNNGDVTLQDKEVAFQLRISNEEWVTTKAELVQKDLINDTNQPTAWDKRQYASDSSAERVARHRAKKKKECNVTVTPPEKETEKEKEIKTYDAKTHLVSLGADKKLVSDWMRTRKEKKLAVTETAIDGFVREVEKSGKHLNDILRVCCENGWGGFKYSWLSKIIPDTRVGSLMDMEGVPK